MAQHPIYATRTAVERPPLVPATTALLLVDLQRYVADPEYGFGRRAREAGVLHEMDGYYQAIQALLPRVQRLLEACRRHGIEVIYARIEAATDDGRDAMLRYRLQGMVIPKGSPEAEILDEVAPLPGEIVLSKTTSSAFNSTRLEQILHARGIERLIVAGVATHACVELTVRDAADLGFWIDWVGDACTAATPELHEATLERNQGGLVDVTSTEAILGLITATGSAAEGDPDGPRNG